VKKVKAKTAFDLHISESDHIYSISSLLFHLKISSQTSHKITEN